MFKAEAVWKTDKENEYGCKDISSAEQTRYDTTWRIS